MKNLFNAVALLLAINFLVVAAGVAWLRQSGHLDKDRAVQIKKILFPPPAEEVPATQPAPEGPPPASQRLAELLAKHAGRSAVDQVEFIQQTFDATTAQLDRREREVADREQQVAAANSKLVADRKTLEGERQKLTEQENQADRLAADKGFQDTLKLYNTMPSKQVKGVFMMMDEESAAEYLDAMEPAVSARILKEFKSSDESVRMNHILDKMRHPPGASNSTTQPAKG